jgi:hypothetical protein
LFSCLLLSFGFSDSIVKEQACFFYVFFPQQELYRPAWVKDDKVTLLERDEGILVTPEEKIESIEFLKKPRQS